MEDQFSDRQEMGKDHERLLALEYSGNMQTYLTRFMQLNSRVQLTGQSLKKVLTAAVTLHLYRNIWRKLGNIPHSDGDLLHAVREAGIEEEELAWELTGKKLIAWP